MLFIKERRHTYIFHIRLETFEVILETGNIILRLIFAFFDFSKQIRKRYCFLGYFWNYCVNLKSKRQNSKNILKIKYNKQHHRVDQYLQCSITRSQVLASFLQYLFSPSFMWKRELSTVIVCFVCISRQSLFSFSVNHHRCIRWLHLLGLVVHLFLRYSCHKQLFFKFLLYQCSFQVSLWLKFLPWEFSLSYSKTSRI